MNEYILDFSLGTKEEKEAFLKKNSDVDVYAELSLFDPEEFYLKYPNLQGVMSFAFSDKSKKGEIHMRKNNPHVIEDLKKLGYTPSEISFVKIGFIVPRTKAMIINEAFYALAEQVANTDDIDRAMEFGVNYPKGPFHWVKGKEKYYYELLVNLRNYYQDSRYEPCSKFHDFFI